MACAAPPPLGGGPPLRMTGPQRDWRPLTPDYRGWGAPVYLVRNNTQFKSRSAAGWHSMEHHGKEIHKPTNRSTVAALSNGAAGACDVSTGGRFLTAVTAMPKERAESLYHETTDEEQS